MKRLFPSCSALLFAAGAAGPALAHFTPAATPHAHAGDGLGLLALVALMAVAVWLDRHSRK